MKIQANAQTKDGVWGVMLTGDSDKIAWSKWLTREEWDAIVEKVAAVPSSQAAPKDEP